MAEKSPRLLRLKDILGDRKADPPIPAKIPISKSSFYGGIQAGRYPAPLKIGPRTAVWRESDIDALIEQADGGQND